MRNHNLDKYRGITIISMVLFHLCYNINLYWRLNWYDDSIINKVWQISIAFSFFVISGISSNYLTYQRNIRRGIISSLMGFGISLFTMIFLPSETIIWGVLNGLGGSMLLAGILSKYMDSSYKLAPIFLALFILSYNIPKDSLYLVAPFSYLYKKNLFFLGFPAKSFYSSDYFPLIPWIFAYYFGRALGKYLFEVDFWGKYGKPNFLSTIGHYSMPIYLIHQIVLFPAVYLAYRLI